MGFFCRFRDGNAFFSAASIFTAILFYHTTIGKSINFFMINMEFFIVIYLQNHVLSVIIKKRVREVLQWVSTIFRKKMC